LNYIGLLLANAKNEPKQLNYEKNIHHAYYYLRTLLDFDLESPGKFSCPKNCAISIDLLL